MQKVSSDGEGSDLDDFDSDRDIPRWVYTVLVTCLCFLQMIVQKMFVLLFKTKKIPSYN
jgi:hypothetical protein